MKFSRLFLKFVIVLVLSFIQYSFRCIYLLVFETALYIAFVFYTVSSLRFNKLCLDLSALIGFLAFKATFQQTYIPANDFLKL